MPAYDFGRMRQEYSDDEIIEALQSQDQSYDWGGMRKAGYSATEIIDAFGKQGAGASAGRTPPQDQPLESDLAGIVQPRQELRQKSIGERIAGMRPAPAEIRNSPSTIYKADNPVLNAALGVPRAFVHGAEQAIQAGAGFTGNEQARKASERRVQGLMLESDLPDLEQGAGSMLAIAPAGLINPAFGAVVGGGLAAGPAIGEGMEAGLSTPEAIAYGVGQGGLEYLTERIPLGILFGKGGAHVAERLVKAFFPEATGEQIATLTQDALRQSVIEPNKPWSEYWAERGEAAKKTLIATAGGLGAAGAIQAGVQRLVPQTNQFADVLDEVVRGTTLKPSGLDIVQDLYDRGRTRFANVPVQPQPELNVPGSASTLAQQPIQSAPLTAQGQATMPDEYAGPGGYAIPQGEADALQEQIPAEVDVREQARDGEEVAIGDAEVQTPAEEGRPQEVAFDVSGRTDEQLAWLAEHGKPGWKEAAIAEGERRGIAPSTATPTTAQTPIQPAPKAKKTRKTGPSNNLIRRIHQLGGINLRYLPDVTGERKVQRGMPVGLFRKNGMGLDDLSRMLADEGFPINVEDPTDIDGVRQLTELLQKTLSGSTVLNYSGQQAMLDAMAKAEAEIDVPGQAALDDPEAIAEREAIKQADIAIQGVTNDELDALLDAAFNDERTPNAILSDEEIDQLFASASDAPQTQPEGQDADSVAGSPEAESFALDAYTPEDLKKREVQPEPELPEAPSPADFVLSGSNRQADEAEARGQTPMFSIAWTSPLADAIQQSKQDTMPAAQWKAWLLANKAKLGLKDDEIQWSGINEYLDLRGKEKVTKAEIADYLSGNGVTVQDVVKGGLPSGWKSREFVNKVGDRMWEVIDETGFQQSTSFDSEGDAIETALKRAPRSRGTKFSGYWDSSYKGGIPGTYREILVTLPEREAAKVDDDGQISFTPEKNNAANFRSSHWDEPNVLVHVRLDEVTGADGKRYVRVGEVQSDWGQKGKKEGFAKPGDASLLLEQKELRNKKDSITARWGGLRGLLVATKTDPDAVAAKAEKDAIDVRLREIEEALGNTPMTGAIRGAAPPSAPFVTDTKAWVALGIKRAILHALDVGADGVVFGTGEQNANLYDLSKQVEKLEWVRDDDAKEVNIGAYQRELDSAPAVDKTVPFGELQDVVGKEIADRILQETKTAGTYRGIDLKVGGEGMRAFYDRIVPQVANEVLKKMGGGKVVSTDVKGGNQPGFQIPDAMRAKVTGTGMPLFVRADGTTGKGMTAASATAHLRKRFGKRIDGMLASNKLKIVATPAQLPAWGKGQRGIGGAWDGTTAWIVASQARPETLAATYLHEVGEHAGMQEMLGDKYQDIITRLDDLIWDGDETANRAASRVPKDTPAKDEQHERLAYFIEEAQRARDAKPQTLSTKARQLLQDIIAAIRAWAYRKFGGITLTEADILALARQSAKQVADRAGQAQGQTTAEAMLQKVWHGTPHIWAPEPGFPHGRPRLDKMGTGEGVQAYGWGWYSAETKEVAGSYIVPPGGKGFSVDGKTYGEWQNVWHDQDKPTRRALTALADSQGNATEALVNLRAQMSPDSVSAAEVLAGWIDQGKITKPEPGSLYQLDIPDDVLPYLLDWNKPLSEQTPEVRDALKRGGSIAKANPRMSGREIYESVARNAPDAFGLNGKSAQQVASEYLASIGIVGNRYLDGQSRNRPLKDIKREFLAELPEDADAGEVAELIGTGKFSPKNDALLRALRDDDWLGFDYPAQAVSAALGKDLGNYDASPELIRAVEDAKEGGTYNFVIWDQPTLDKIALLERNGEKLDAMREAEVLMSRDEELSSEYEIPNSSGNAITTPIDGSKLRELRLAASSVEAPDKGITFQVTEDGRAIVTGPARTRVPARFQRFAEQHGLTLVVRRGPVDNISPGRMPDTFRASGALYFGEISPGIDRTGRVRFSKEPQSTDAEEMAKKFGFAIKGMADARIQPSAERAYIENQEMFERMKRGVVSNADSRAAGEALAAEVGWSPDSVDAFMKEAAQKGTPPVDILAAMFAMSRMQSIKLLEAQNPTQFIEYTMDVLRTLMATRAYGSEMGRALQFIGAMERMGGYTAADVTGEGGSLPRGQIDAPGASTIAIDKDVSRQAADLAKEVVETGEFNETLRKTADAKMSEAEMEAEVKQLEADLAKADKALSDARKAREAARQKRTEARQSLKHANDLTKSAQESTAKHQANTVPAADIKAAEDAMRAAQAEREKAWAALVKARQTLMKAKKMREKAQGQTQTMTGKAQAAKQKTISNIAAALTEENLRNALGGDKGIQKIMAAMHKQGKDVDLGMLVSYLSGMVDSIAKEQSENRSTLNKLMAMHVELWRANILTGLFTHEVNVTSNAANMLIEFGLVNPIQEMLPGGIGLGGYLDALKAMGGYRKVLADIWALMKYSAFEEAPASRLSHLLDQRDPELLALMRGTEGSKWADTHRKFIPGLAGKVVRGAGFVPLGIEDAIFKVIPFRYELARQQAAGEQRNVTAAIDAANKLTFQDSTGMLGMVVAKMHEKAPYSEFWITFVKTMTNLIKRSFDLTPGLSQAKNWDALIGNEGDKARREAVALSIVGVGIASMVMALMGDDDDEVQLSGFAPSDRLKKLLWLEEHDNIGLRIGDEVYPFYRMSPLAEPAGLTIGAYNSIKQGEAGPLFNAMYQSIVTKHFMAKIADLIDGIEEVARAEGNEKSEAGERLVRRQLGGIATGTMIPNFIAQLGDMTDAEKREVNTIMQDLQKKIPVLRESLPSKLKVTGEVMGEPRYMSPFPVQGRPVKKDEVTRWLLKLGRGIDPNPKSIKDLPHDVRQTLLRERWEFLGYAYEASKDLDAETQEKIIRKMLSAWAENAKAARVMHGLETQAD